MLKHQNFCETKGETKKFLGWGEGREMLLWNAAMHKTLSAHLRHVPSTPQPEQQFITASLRCFISHKHSKGPRL